MVFSHCWVGSPGWLCLPATTSFEFLIRKPPCNYWINVNYESWLGLRHRYRYRRTRVKLSLPLPLYIYIHLSHFAISFSHSIKLYISSLFNSISNVTSVSLQLSLILSLSDSLPIFVHSVQPLIVPPSSSLSLRSSLFYHHSSPTAALHSFPSAKPPTPALSRCLSCSPGVGDN